MANRVRGEAEVEIAGAKYTLKLDHEAIANLEDALGFGLLGLAKKISQDKAGYRDIVAIIHSALPPADRSRLSAEDVGKAVLATGLFSWVKHAVALVGPVMAGGIGLEEEKPVKKVPKA